MSALGRGSRTGRGNAKGDWPSCSRGMGIGGGFGRSGGGGGGGGGGGTRLWVRCFRSVANVGESPTEAALDKAAAEKATVEKFAPEPSESLEAAEDGTRADIAWRSPGSRSPDVFDAGGSSAGGVASKRSEGCATSIGSEPITGRGTDSARERPGRGRADGGRSRRALRSRGVALSRRKVARES
jgi:hypothetical protein